MKKAVLMNLICPFLLAGCVNAGTSQPINVLDPDRLPEPTQTAAVEGTVETIEQQPAIAATPSIRDRVTIIPRDGESALTIEEHPMLPSESVEDVLFVYEDESWATSSGFQSQLTIGEDVYSYFIEEEPVEEGVGDQTPNLPNLIVLKNDQQVLSTPLGKLNTIHPIWAFVASEGEWYLELYREEGAVDENGQELPVGGDIFRSGESLNTLYEYDESFGLHLVSGLPFYFYVRDGAFGYVYNGVETPLDYSDIRHYGCCSAGQANPRGSEDRVVIFATRGDQLYLVMIRDFEE